MFNNIKGVLFDLDGTMFDTMMVWTQIDKDFLDENGFIIDYEELKKDIEGLSMGETADYFIERFNMNVSRKTLMERWNIMALDYYENKVLPKEGLINFVKKLYEKNIKMAVASSNSRFLIEAVLRSNGIIDYMDAIVTSDEVKKSKPFPDVYLKAAEKIGVAIEKCLVFEDLLAGLNAGKTAGAKTCVIYDEYSKLDWKEKCDFADYNINNYLEVIGLINE